MVIFTAQLHSTKPELRSCAGSNHARGNSRWRGSLTMVLARNKAKCFSLVNPTVPQRQFIIIFSNWKLLLTSNINAEMVNDQRMLKNAKVLRRWLSLAPFNTGSTDVIVNISFSPEKTIDHLQTCYFVRSEKYNWAINYCHSRQTAYVDKIF